MTTTLWVLWAASILVFVGLINVEYFKLKEINRKLEKELFDGKLKAYEAHLSALNDRAKMNLQHNFEIDERMLNTIILLCHPDKHNNSEASTKAMKFLLNFREEYRRGNNGQNQ